MSKEFEIQLGEKSIGQHGSNIYFKDFSTKFKCYKIGKFYFVRKSEKYPVAIAEIQLVWLNEITRRKLASVKLYLKPNDNDNIHGKDEVVEASRQVVIDCEKFPLWECSIDLWDSNVGDKVNKNVKPNQVAGLDNDQNPMICDNSCDVAVLSFPQYCRYHTCLKMLNAGCSMTFKKFLACGGVDIKNPNTIIVFSKRKFECEEIEDYSLTTDVPVPVFKGRPRKRKKNLIIGDTIQNKKTKKIYSASPVKHETGKRKQEILPRRIRGLATVTKHQQPDEDREAKDRFSKDLHNFMEQNGTPILKIPSIGCATIEPLSLYEAVKSHGGYYEVTDRKLWSQVYNCLGHSTIITNAATGTRKIYEKLLLPYDIYLSSTENKLEKDQDDNSTNKEPLSNSHSPRNSNSIDEQDNKKVNGDSKIVPVQKIPTVPGKAQKQASSKFNNQIERLRRKQIETLASGTNKSKEPGVNVLKRPSWINELNVDILNFNRKKLSSKTILNDTKDRPSDLKPIVSTPVNFLSSSNDQNPPLTSNTQIKSIVIRSDRNAHIPRKILPKPGILEQDTKQIGSVNLVIQSVKSLAPSTSIHEQKHKPNNQYIYHPKSSVNRITRQTSQGEKKHGPDIIFQDTSAITHSPKTFRNNYSTENSCYKIKSSALKNHEPYIIHHPSHVNKIRKTTGENFPSLYAHHPRYVRKVNVIPSSQITNKSRHELHAVTSVHYPVTATVSKKELIVKREYTPSENKNGNVEIVSGSTLISNKVKGLHAAIRVIPDVQIIPNCNWISPSKKITN